MKLFIASTALVLTLLGALPTKINGADEFKFGFYTDNTCTVPKGIDDQNPWTVDPSQCFGWQRAGGPANSIEVLSCSSTCICFAQSPGSLDCSGTVNGNIKESCTNKCNADDQGSFLGISEFAGCGALQVPDSEYECGCTKMVDNNACSTSSSVSTPPTAAPTFATTQTGLCDISDLMGQTIFFAVAGHCWRLPLHQGAMLEGDSTDPTCNKDESDFTSTGVFSIADTVNMSDNTAVFTVGAQGYSGTFQFKEGPVTVPAVNVMGWDPSAKIYEVELTIPTCSPEAVCPTMRVLPF